MGLEFDPHTGTAFNCGRCEKCIRTIAALDIIGKLDDFPAFANHEPISFYMRPETLAGSKTKWLRDLYELASRRERKDWVHAVHSAATLHKRNRGR